MKHIFAVMLASVLCLSLTACGDGQSGADTHLTLVTDSGLIDDQSFNQSIYEGMEAYAIANDVAYDYIIPEEESAEARVASIADAVEGGATCILLPGYLFGESVAQVQELFPQVSFLLLDITAEEVQSYGVEEIAEDVALIRYREEQSGYLAGYAAVMDGYTQLGFVGGEEVPAVVRYGYGYLQGINDGAQELDVEVTVNYWYGDSFVATDEIEEKMLEWYQEGTQVIFSCGGSIYGSVLVAAERANTGGKVIGVDVDQGELSSLFITSAMKDLGNSVVVALEELGANGGTWPADYAGSEITLGASEGAVGLPTDPDHWRFETFTVEDYEVVLDDIISGDIVVSDAIDIPPATDSGVTVYYFD